MARSKAKVEDSEGAADITTIKAPGFFASKGAPTRTVVPDGGYVFSIKSVKASRSKNDDGSNISVAFEVIDVKEDRNANQIGSLVYENLYFMDSDHKDYEKKLSNGGYQRDISINNARAIVNATKIKVKEEDDENILKVIQKTVGKTLCATAKKVEDKQSDSGFVNRFSRWSEDKDADKDA